MSKSVTLTDLRKNIYKWVDSAITTGEEIIISRKGTYVRIVHDANRQPRSLKKLFPHKTIQGNPDDLVHGGTTEWNELKNLL